MHGLKIILKKHTHTPKKKKKKKNQTERVRKLRTLLHKD